MLLLYNTRDFEKGAPFKEYKYKSHKYLLINLLTVYPLFYLLLFPDESENKGTKSILFFLC